MAIITVTTSGTVVAVSNGDKVVIDIPGGGDVTIVAASPNVRRVTIEFVDDTEDDTAIVDLSTFERDDLHIDVREYNTTDKIELLGGFNKTVDPGNLDELNFDFIGADGETYSGFVRAKDKGERDFTTDPSPITICFAKGTIIETDLGPVVIEVLSVGDLVKTQDHGLRPIRWIGKRHLNGTDLESFPHMRPVRIAAGALGHGRPFRDLFVSPQHRISICDWRANLLFGEIEVFAPAKSLVGQPGIEIAEVQEVTYYHLLFDAHEIVTSNGVATESLHPGDMALPAIGDGAMQELAALFPDLPEELTARRTARPVLRNYEMQAARRYSA